jgi:hypothetical protein
VHSTVVPPRCESIFISNVHTLQVQPNSLLSTSLNSRFSDVRTQRNSAPMRFLSPTTHQKRYQAPSSPLPYSQPAFYSPAFPFTKPPFRKQQSPRLPRYQFLKPGLQREKHALSLLPKPEFFERGACPCSVLLSPASQSPRRYLLAVDVLRRAFFLKLQTSDSVYVSCALRSRYSLQLRFRLEGRVLETLSWQPSTCSSPLQLYSHSAY